MQPQQIFNLISFGWVWHENDFTPFKPIIYVYIIYMQESNTTLFWLIFRMCNQYTNIIQYRHDL